MIVLFVNLTVFINYGLKIINQINANVTLQDKLKKHTSIGHRVLGLLFVLHSPYAVHFDFLIGPMSPKTYEKNEGLSMKIKLLVHV